MTSLITAFTASFAELLATESWLRLRAPRNVGMAMPNRMPMMSTTTNRTDASNTIAMVAANG